MEPDHLANTSRLHAIRSTARWAVLSSNIGAMFKTVLYSDVFWLVSVEAPAPEPSRVDWEDTQ